MQDSDGFGTAMSVSCHGVLSIVRTERSADRGWSQPAAASRNTVVYKFRCVRHEGGAHAVTIDDIPGNSKLEMSDNKT
jgi:hypothetical protein